MCAISVLSPVVLAVCMAECHTRASPVMEPCLSCLCRAHVWAIEGEIGNAKGMFRPSTPFGDTWGWWSEFLGISQLVWEMKHPPFPPYCAFLLCHSQKVFPDTSPTCVSGSRCVGNDQPVRSPLWPPMGTLTTSLGYLPSSAEIPSFPLSAVVAE